MACRVAKMLCMSLLLVCAFTLSAMESSYTIKEGETLTSVARRVEVPVDVLSLFNGISDPDKLRAGTVLRVPPYVMHLYRENCIDNPARAQMASDLAAARKPIVVAPQPTYVAATEPAVSSDRKQPAYTYSVGRNETLAEIADRKDCDANELARANNLRVSQRLRKGQKLRMVGCYRR